MAEQHHVVVDGSNLATEGRTTPSLAQLDEAVQAFAAEDPDAQIVVVVDASFEHRIDPSEREMLEQAELHGEVVSPPAGAIGRGDAFVLRIAERTGAVVLSNDSFQEFHGEHPWLFEAGRLIGGKPVPGIGWIFTPRIPVRGPKSRQATGKAKREASRAEELAPPVKAAELAKAARRVAKAAKRVGGRPPQVGDVWAPSPTPGPDEIEPDVATGVALEPETALAVVAEPAATATKKAPAKKAAAKKAATKKAPAKKAAAKKAPATKAPAKKATEKAPAKKAATKAPAKPAKKGAAKKEPAKKEPAKKEPAKKSAAKPAKATKKAAEKPATETAAADGATPAPTATRARATKKVVAVPTESPAARRSSAPTAAVISIAPEDDDVHRPLRRRIPATPAPAAPLLSSGSPRVGVDDEILEAIDQATAEALSPPPPTPKAKGAGKAEQKQKGKHKRRRRTSTPPPAVNEPLAFITFVAAFPVGSEVEGEVASFTSHGAMVEVELPEGGVLHCYIPLSGLGDPAPRKAREVLGKGERRSFVLISLDPPRRVAELALPGVVPSPAVSA